MTKDIAILKNKNIFFVGVNTGYLTNGEPDDRFVDFYTARSSERLYCALVGNVVVPDGVGTNSHTPMISRNIIWKRLAESIYSKGTKPGIQLSTTWQGYQGNRRFVTNSLDEYTSYTQKILENINPSNLLRILDGFSQGRDLVISQTYKHVQLHAAHGYMLCLLLDRRFSPFVDYILEWLLDFVACCKQAGVEVSIRLSIRSGYEVGVADNISIIRDISKIGFDYIDLSSGYYNIDKRLIYPSNQSLLNDRFQDTIKIARKYVNQKYIYSGRAFSMNLNSLPSNVDIGLCRDLISNPSFLYDLDKGCLNYNKCHYYSRGENYLICKNWSR